MMLYITTYFLFTGNNKHFISFHICNNENKFEIDLQSSCYMQFGLFLVVLKAGLSSVESAYTVIMSSICRVRAVCGFLEVLIPDSLRCANPELVSRRSCCGVLFLTRRTTGRGSTRQLFLRPSRMPDKMSWLCIPHGPVV